MADSIPRSYLKEIADTLVAEDLYVAFFTSSFAGYTEIAASSLYSGLTGEVSASGTGYTTGGYSLSSLVASTIGSTNAVKLTASATTVTNASLTVRYLVVYNHNTSKIRFVKDLLADKPITNGVFTITWNATDGIFKISFTA